MFINRTIVMNFRESNFSFIPYAVCMLRGYIATESQLFNSMLKVRTLFDLHLDHHLIWEYSQNTLLTFLLRNLYESRHTGSRFIRESHTSCKYKSSEKDFNYNSSCFYYLK